MVNARRLAATQLAASRRKVTEPQASRAPSTNASPACTRPVGIGRRLVRRMTASISASHHMLSVPAAPAPTAMADYRVDGAWRQGHSDQRRENDQRHDPRLEKQDVVTDVAGNRLPGKRQIQFAAIEIGHVTGCRSTSSADARQGFPLMEGWRRGQRPLERGGTRPPWIVAG